MQRIRMSLPYFKESGYEAEVVTVYPSYSDLPVDELLSQTVPPDTRVHYVKAFDKTLTSKIGLGSIALRSLYYYRKKVNELLREKKYDLVYFSTTQFPVCILGAYWKKRFQIPYVIDMQDPWYSEYYNDKPPNQRPAKYWFSYRLNKYLEPLAIKSASGLISVAEAYITALKSRYPKIGNIPAATITFGAFAPDLKIATDNSKHFSRLLDNNCINIVYIGRGGYDMHKAVKPLFDAFKAGLSAGVEPFSRLRFYFIGTSYAPNGQAKKTIEPFAKKFGIGEYVTEITDRIGYYHNLITLQQADALFIPGSDDYKYTASKIYPYLLVQKPLLAIFHKGSSAINILKEYGVENVYSYQDTKQKDIINFLKFVTNGSLSSATYDADAIEKYSAENMALKQCQLFDKVINGKN
jgi:hypothetical protein